MTTSRYYPDIDVTKVNLESHSDDASLLYQFLLNNKEDVIKPDEKLTAKDQKGNASYFRLDYQAGYGLLKRKRSHSNETVYEVIGPRIGAGENGEVFKSVGYLYFDHVRKKICFKSREMAIKHVTKESEDYLIKEYQMTRLAGLFKVKSPIIFQKKYSLPKKFEMYMVIQFIKGHTLAEVAYISSDGKFLRDADLRLLNNNQKFTADERIKISINLLKCVKQLNRRNMVCDDMHNLNVMIDPVTFDAFIIDFGGPVSLVNAEQSDRLKENIYCIICHIRTLWLDDIKKGENEYDHLKNLGLNDKHISELLKFMRLTMNDFELSSVDLFIDQFRQLGIGRLLDSTNGSKRSDLENSISQANLAVHEINTATSKLDSLVAHASIIIKYAQSIKNDEICVKTFVETLGINYLLKARTTDDVINTLIEVTKAYASVEEKKGDIIRIKNILLSCEEMAKNGARQEYDHNRISNYLQYIEYLLNEKTANMTIRDDIVKVAQKLDKFIAEILSEVNHEETPGKLFPFMRKFANAGLTDKLSGKHSLN